MPRNVPASDTPPTSKNFFAQHAHATRELLKAFSAIVDMQALGSIRAIMKELVGITVSPPLLLCTLFF